MLDVALLVFFGVMAYRIVSAVRREAPIFLEFRQSKALAMTALLFPLGPIATILLIARSPILAFTAGLACYLPSLFIARRITSALERAGTDRVQQAKAAASQAFGTALVGVIYAVGVFLYVVILAVYFSTGANA
jgi:hypothetical protein